MQKNLKLFNEMLKFRFFAIGLLFCQITFGQSYKTEQTTLIIKKTADWCPFCGSYGWDFFDGLYQQVSNDNNAILVAMHYSGGLQNVPSVEITNNYNIPGQPVFIVNNDDILVGSSNVTQKINQTKTAITNNAKITAPISLDLALYKTGSNYTARIEAKAAQDLAGVNIFAGLYLVRNNLIHDQQGRGTSVSHINVLEKNLIDGSTWGKPLFTGDVTKNTTATVDVTIPTFSTSANVKLLLIVWNKLSNGTYRFMNAQMINSNTISTTASKEESLAKSISVFASTQEINASWPGKSIERGYLSNSLGQMVTLSKLDGNESTTRFAKPNIPAGVYILTLFSEGKQATKPIYLSE